MAIPKTIWSELWRRVIEREAVGIALEVSDANAGRNALYRTRPANCADYTICQTPNPNIIFIVRPGYDPHEARTRHAAAEVFNDLTEPLP